MVDYLAIIGVAFFGSVGHCVGMCGGFVLAYSSSKFHPDASLKRKSILHFIYNLGRISSYAILGGICGYLGSVVSYSQKASGYVYFVVGIFMVLFGLSLLGKFKFLSFFESSWLFNSRIKYAISYLLHSKKALSFYFLGALNGLFPCGLVYFFLSSAVLSANVIDAVIIMLIFGFSTLPIMLLTAFASNILYKEIFRQTMMKIASLVIIIYGIYLSFNGFMITQS